MIIKAVGYVRLSKEDLNLGEFDESESISNQKQLIQEYVLQQGWELQHIYVDEDITGSDRNRPSFNEMIAAAYSGKFDIVVVKKQSRFARDLELIEKYILNEFIERGIRFISILDNIDTALISSSMRKSSQINGLIDQWYLEDLSESVKASFKVKRQRGETICSYAPYGYLKDPDNHNHLVPDPNTADNVRRIFHMYNNGFGTYKIANILNSEGVLNPYGYKKQFTTIKLKETELSTLWRGSTINYILKNETYIGTVVSGMYRKSSYKSKKLLRAPREEWTKIPGMHEPLIEEDLWNSVQEKLAAGRSRAYKGGKRHPLAGKIFCMNCKKKMQRNGAVHLKNGDTHSYFSCSTKGISPELCEGATIEQNYLENIILQKINALIEKYLDEDYQLEKLDLPEKSIYEQKLKSIEKNIKDLLLKKKILYQDRLNGVISVDEYTEIANEIDSSIQSYERKKTDIIKITGESDKEKFDQKIKLLNGVRNINELTTELADAFIDKIYIKNTSKKGKKEIEIIWKF